VGKLCTQMGIDYNIGRVKAESVVPRLAALVPGLSRNSFLTEQCRQTCHNVDKAEILDHVPQPAVVAASAILLTVMAYNMLVDASKASPCSQDPGSVVHPVVLRVGRGTSLEHVSISQCITVFADFAGVCTHNVTKAYHRLVGYALTVLAPAFLSHKLIKSLPRDTVVTTLTKLSLELSSGTHRETLESTVASSSPFAAVVAEQSEYGSHSSIKKRPASFSEAFDEVGTQTSRKR
jgi:membrane-associated HD superfamily phosphohydrolase